MLNNLNSYEMELNYTDQGSGFPLVFLHGYLESADIWSEFTPLFTKAFRVICFDLPGHGKSETDAEVSSMESMAQGVEMVLNSLEIDQALIIGHSMGGYTALALLELYPEKMAGLVLFHTHPKADSEVVLEKRRREINIVDAGQKHLLVAQNIPNMFAKQNLPKFDRELKITQAIARQTPANGMKAAIRGLMQRPDRTEVLAQTKVPTLQIIGKYDKYIPFEEVSMKVVLPVGSQRLILENSGHMGFFEEKEKSSQGIKEFVQSLIP